MLARSFGWLSSLSAMLIGVGGCGPTVSDLMTPRELVEFFQPPWIVINLPSSLYYPGAVVEVTEQEGIQWLGDGRQCFTGGVLKPEKGATPQWTLTKQSTFNASMMANIKGITLGPEFKKDGKVSLKIENAETEVIDVIKLFDWMLANKDKISESCRKYLLSKNVFLIREAYRVDKASYTLYDQKGAKLSLGGEKLKDLLKLSADFKYEVTGDGALAISSPVYIAFRRAKFIGLSERPEVLGTPTAEPDAGVTLRKYYEKNLEQAFGLK